MRRGMSMPRGRGNNRPAPRPQNPRQASGQPGPLMTGHLQGLKDIDMELELLKRKREIIEQQQQILSNSYRQRNDYEQPMFSESRDDRYDDYTRLYDDDSRSNSYGPNRKRTHVPVWENESPPKRFSAPSRGVRHSFGSRLGPPPNNPRPSYQRPAAPKTSNPRPKKNFNPTKVTKPSAPAAPKLASYKPAERKKLVTGALASHDWILRIDVTPTPQMNGRLELALGSVIKQLKHDNPKSENIFKSPQAVRAMKQEVRDRIRTAMIGKPITTSDNIKAIYREMFPQANDDEVLMKGLEIQNNAGFSIIKSDDPETFFRHNMNRLMSKKLKEMVTMLEELYKSKYPKNKKNKNLPKSKAPTKEQPESPAKVIEAPETGEVNTEKVDNANAEETGEAQQETGTSADNSQPQADDNVSKPDETPANLDESAPSDDVQIITEEMPQPSSEEMPQPSKAEIEQKESEESAKLISNPQYLAFDKLMNYNIIHLLKKFSPAMLKIMDVDTMYFKMKTAIYNETRRKLGAAPAPVTPNTTLNLTEKPERKNHLQYYVKILGKPALPKRKLMEAFFEEYKPKSIKKHRTVHNLLFVGFADKEPFERILAANGTAMGRYTLDIKVSEKNFGIGKNKMPRTVNLKSTDDLGPELDEQITDLLSSIRKAEEEGFSEDVVMVEEPKTEGGETAASDAKIEAQASETVEAEASESVEAQASATEMKEETEKTASEVIEIDDDALNEDVVHFKDIPQEVLSGTAENGDTGNGEQIDAVPDLKTEEVKGTPTRASARLATPGGIRTRRMSKLTE